MGDGSDRSVEVFGVGWCSALAKCLLVAVITREQDPDSLVGHGDPRQDGRHRRCGARRLDQLRGAREAADRLEILDRREDQFDVALTVSPKRIVRSNPLICDHLTGIVSRSLQRRSGGHEESSVVTPRRALGGDPMGKVVKVTDIEGESLVRDDVEETTLTGVHVGPVSHEALCYASGELES